MPRTNVKVFFCILVFTLNSLQLHCVSSHIIITISFIHLDVFSFSSTEYVVVKICTYICVCNTKSI